MIRSIIQCVCLGCCGLWAWAADTGFSQAGVAVETFSAWDNCLALKGGDCRVVVAPAVGGRIIHYSINGDNILYEEPGSGGKTLAGAPGGFEMAGYQVGPGPLSRGLPAHPGLWLGPWRAQAPRAQLVQLESPPDPALGIRLAKEVLVDPDTGELGLQQRLINESKESGVFCLWDRTVCKGGGYALIPLKAKSRFKAGWAVGRTNSTGGWAWENPPPSESRVRVLDRVLVVQAGRGGPLPVGADSDQDWVAYTVGQLLLVKYRAHAPNAAYPEGGLSVLFQGDDRRAELGLFSPEARLQPGQSQSLPEKWVLIDLERSAASWAEARSLAKTIPPSPFRR